MSDEKWLKREVFDVVGKIAPAASPFSNPPITRSQDVNSFRLVAFLYFFRRQGKHSLICLRKEDRD